MRQRHVDDGEAKGSSRRDFLRQVGMGAVSVGTVSASVTLAGCGDDECPTCDGSQAEPCDVCSVDADEESQVDALVDETSDDIPDVSQDDDEGPSPYIPGKVVDVQSHVMSPPDMVEPLMTAIGTMIEEREGNCGVLHYPMIPPSIPICVYEAMVDPEVFVNSETLGLASLDDNIDIICTVGFVMIMEMLCTALPVQTAGWITEKFNDSMKAFCDRYPELTWLVNVNPFDEGAMAEISRCIDMGSLVGATIASNVGGRYPDDFAWESSESNKSPVQKFLEHCAGEGIPVYLHPAYVPYGDIDLMNEWRFEETLGRPADSTMALLRMIYHGVFDRDETKDLKVILAHTGEMLPWIMDRADFGYDLGYPKEEASWAHKPSWYLVGNRNIYIDTMGFNPKKLAFALDFGIPVDHIVFGSDFAPVPIGIHPNVGVQQQIELIAGIDSSILSNSDKDLIFWQTANSLFNLGLS